MPGNVTPVIPEQKKKSRILNKLLNLSQVEQQTKLRYLDMDVKVFEHASNESWVELASLAKQGRGNALTTLARLKGMSKVAAQQMPFEAADFRKVFMDSEFRKGLENFMTESGRDISSIDRYLDKTNYNKVKNGPKTLIDNTLCEQGSYAVAIGFTGYWAGFFSEFNLECQKSGPVSFEKNDIETIADFLSGQNKNLWSHLFKFKEILAECAPDDIYNKSMSILLELEEQLVWLPSFAAKIYLSLEKSIQEQKTSLIRVLAKMDLNIGIFARKWALVTAVALYSAYIGTLREDNKEFKEIKKNSQKLPLKSQIPYGEKVTLQELSEKGWHHNSKLIQVSGFVRNIGVSRAGGVYRTEFTLADITGRHQIQAIAVYENLAHQGMINGSYVNLNGLWEMTSKIAEHPIIKINRVALSKLKKESWIDYMATTVRPWFDLYPNSHNLVWSVRPENKGGEIAKESTKTGAGEIEFSKTFLYKGGK